MARPTIYEESFIKKVDEYLATCVDKQSFVRDGKMAVFRQKVSLPTIEGFSLFLDCAKSSIYEWAKNNKEFSDALEKITVEQHKRLLDEGLAGNYNATIAKLILSSNHGMSEKTQTDITTKGEKVSGISALDLLAEKMDKSNREEQTEE